MKSFVLLIVFFICSWSSISQNADNERLSGQCVLLDSDSSDLVYSCDNVREINSKNISVYRDRLVSYYDPQLISVDLVNEKNKIRVSFKKETSGSIIDEVFEHFNVKAR